MKVATERAAAALGAIADLMRGLGMGRHPEAAILRHVRDASPALVAHGMKRRRNCV